MYRIRGEKGMPFFQSEEVPHNCRLNTGSFVLSRFVIPPHTNIYLGRRGTLSYSFPATAQNPTTLKPMLPMTLIRQLFVILVIFLSMAVASEGWSNTLNLHQSLIPSLVIRSPARTAVVLHVSIFTKNTGIQDDIILQKQSHHIRASFSYVLQ